MSFDPLVALYDEAGVELGVESDPAQITRLLPIGCHVIGVSSVAPQEFGSYAVTISVP